MTLLTELGGYPFEFANFDYLQSYLSVRGFSLIKGHRSNGLGNYEMVFQRQHKNN